MPSNEYSGLKISGGKVFAIFTLLGALGGAAWTGFTLSGLLGYEGEDNSLYR